jgi:hypothetical protein
MAEHPAAGPLLLRQVRYQNKLFLRNPFSAFFALAFPLMFLLLFGSLNGNEPIGARGGIRFAQFLTPGLLVFAVVSTCYTGLAVGVAMNRDLGILKRIRGTPCPPGSTSPPASCRRCGSRWSARCSWWRWGWPCSTCRSSGGCCPRRW